jgi:hypothetical protein
VLDKQKCLDALAALRHAKWFQVWRNSSFMFNKDKRTKHEIILFSLVSVKFNLGFISRMVEIQGDNFGACWFVGVRSHSERNQYLLLLKFTYCSLKCCNVTKLNKWQLSHCITFAVVLFIVTGFFCWRYSCRTWTSYTVIPLFFTNALSTFL